ncbi:MAG: Unknown protein [uncultured Sulfurovum sp.]|uniref:Response regulatory domain-containing protein n=1 Tax=uncultured Sulfurovum sp. TaxID=269237 RepID=A0A6S6TEL1_9BACT|nr:MAG: Unknown protein [uncultured Sulfurovum sp.]
MKIVWLEDEPETIDVVRRKLEIIYRDIIICKSFASFSDELDELEDKSDEVLILDIRMIFNTDIEVTCKGSEAFTIIKELEGGFEYYQKCLKARFNNLRILFFSSKPQKEAQEEAHENDVPIEWIISKDNTMQLLEKIKEIKC